MPCHLSCAPRWLSLLTGRFTLFLYVYIVYIFEYMLAAFSAVAFLKIEINEHIKEIHITYLYVYKCILYLVVYHLHYILFVRIKYSNA